MLQGLNPGKYVYKICDLQGKLLQRGSLNTAENSISLTGSKNFTGLVVIQVAPANSPTNTVTLTVPIK
jgi:hypothetical protein